MWLPRSLEQMRIQALRALWTKAMGECGGRAIGYIRLDALPFILLIPYSLAARANRQQAGKRVHLLLCVLEPLEEALALELRLAAKGNILVDDDRSDDTPVGPTDRKG